MNQLKKLVPDIVAIVLFAIISVAYFFPAITEGRILAQHDAVAGIGAGREHQEYYEKHGKATRWTNSLFSGMPTYIELCSGNLPAVSSYLCRIYFYHAAGFLHPASCIQF